MRGRGERDVTGYVCTTRLDWWDALEADHYWFWFQADAPDFFYAMLDLVFQG